jgi:hypothetical protein
MSIVALPFTNFSDAPAGGSSGRLISTMSTASGASVMSRIG